MTSRYDHHSRLAEHHQRLAEDFEAQRQAQIARYVSRTPKTYNSNAGGMIPRLSMEQTGYVRLHDELAGRRDEHMQAARHHGEQADIHQPEHEWNPGESDDWDPSYRGHRSYGEGEESDAFHQ